MITLTPEAVQKVKGLLKKENKPTHCLRLGVRTGGCSGLNYQLGFDEKKEGDHEFEFEGVKVVIDPKSYPYMDGTQVDFADTLQESGFKFTNPNADKTCGCGESFSV